MSELHVKLYLDEDVAVLIAEIARSAGFDAITTRDAKHRQLGDSGQLEFATREARAIVTHNRDDFRNLHELYAERGLEHAGIIIAIRRRVVYDVARRLLVFLDGITADEMRSQIRVV